MARYLLCPSDKFQIQNNQPFFISCYQGLLLFNMIVWLERRLHFQVPKNKLNLVFALHFHTISQVELLDKFWLLPDYSSPS